MEKIIEQLYKEHNISDEDLTRIIESSEYDMILFEKADYIRRKYYSNKVYLRGLIEISSFCRNNCYYCGIRASNLLAERYRLSPDDIISCCDHGYELGFRTFVLQGGEDAYYTDDIICCIVSEIKNRHPDSAVTLSLGEKSYETYMSYRKAGADRYLLRHETANDNHYQLLHPETMKLSDRKNCLYNLKKLGFQTGAGFMVGSPFQKTEHIIEDIRFLQELKPEMIGIGPFISHKDTPFRDYKNGSAELTVRLLAILRLMFPDVLLPATTALGTIIPDGRERGIKAGANVVMPNLSPSEYRKKYSLYDNKICTGEEAAECLECLKRRMNSIGFTISSERGDYAGLSN